MAMRHLHLLTTALLAALPLLACDDDPATTADAFVGAADARPDGAQADRGPAPDADRPDGSAPADAAPPADGGPVADQALPDAEAADGALDAAEPDAAAPDAAAPDAAAPDQGGPPPPATPIYDPGPLAVTQQRVEAGEAGAPVAAEIFSPDTDAPSPVVLFQHGFLMDVRWHRDLLTHVASHGFVVVAPQMYAADGLPIGKPTAAQEAADAAQVLGWIDDGLAAVIDTPLDGAAPGIAGHSRGGKVTWLMMAQNANRARAIAGIDPVDGQGGPLGGEARVLDNNLDFGGVPALVLGTGLGSMPLNLFSPACAPEGDAHVRFYTRTSSPVWHGVATAHGHNDLLDDDAMCGLVCLACAAGPDRASMRRYVAGQLVALFRGALMGDDAAFALLEDADAAPLPATVERR